MAETEILVKPSDETATAVPWNVIVHDDPVNLMGYVTLILMRIFGYQESTARRMMLEVHHRGRSIVWCGEREKAEFYAQQLQAHQLKASLEKAE